MRRIGFLAAVAAVALTAAAPAAAQFSDGESGGSDAGVGIALPSFDARLSMGFNYDLLRSLTDVSFSYPAGYFGLNLPIGIGGNFVSKDMIDDIFENSDLFRAGDNFKPTTAASQNANTTIRVDVPMLNGVGSFAYTQNFFFNFNTSLGGTSVLNGIVDIGEHARKEGSSDDISGFLSLRGALRLPLSVTMNWETMTFGYAYRVPNRDELIFALNLHRHLFAMDMKLRADIDLLGHVSMNANVDMGNDAPPMNMVINDDLINFYSEKCNGSAQGRYRAEAWTPSLGVRWGRLRLDSRFGLDVKAKGSARGGFVVPRVVNLETGKVTLVEKFDAFGDSLASNPLYVFDMLNEESGIIPREVDRVEYEINETMRWTMPQGHTFTFDILRNKLAVSYTKTFGEVNLKITDILRTTRPESSEPGSWLDGENDILEVDLGVRIDHIVMLQYTTPSFFLNAGLCGIEARSGENYVFEDMNLIRLGGVTMAMPVLSGGLILGTRLQLQLEANVLPLPAFKTGVNYFF